MTIQFKSKNTSLPGYLNRFLSRLIADIEKKSKTKHGVNRRRNGLRGRKQR